MGRYRKHPMGLGGIRQLMFNRVCLKEGHNFLDVCKLKDCQRFGRHVHSGNIISTLSKNSQNNLMCDNCNLEKN